MNIQDTSIHPQCPWYDMYEKFGPANVKWCEERLCALINEPLNTWSNVPFMLVGLFILFLGFKQVDRFKKIFGSAVFLMGFGSFFYHATNNYLTQIFDFIGMYLYVYLLLCLCLLNLKKITIKTSVYLYTLLVVLSVLAIPIARQNGFPYQMIVFIVNIPVFGLLLYLRKKMGQEFPTKYLVLSLGFFITAAAFSYMDVSRIICNPQHPYFQGHALWHALGAIGTYFSYLLFSEIKLKLGSYNH